MTDRCDICRCLLGLPLEPFYQVKGGFRCESCYRDEAYSHPLLGWFFRWLARSS